VTSILTLTKEGEQKTVVQVLDITDKIETSKALKEVEIKYRTLFENSPYSIILSDINAKLITANPKTLELFAYKSHEDILDKNKTLLDFVHESDRKRSFRDSQRTIKADLSGPFKYLFLKNNKSVFLGELSGSVIRDDKGKPIAYMAIIKDISEQEEAIQSLKKTSDKLANKMRAANDGMWDWHLSSGVVEFDPRYYEMAGYKVDEFEHNLTEFQNRVHADDLAQVMEKAQAHLDGKTDRFIVEFRFLKKDRSWMWILGRGIIVERDEKEEPLRLMGTHTDISELKSIQNDLRIAKNKAEESDRLKSSFLANMSHEIRTPMNGILGFSSLLQDKNISKKEQEDYLNIIQKSGNRMLSTIDDIIDISKIEAGQMDLSRTEFNLNETISFLYNFFHPEIKKKELILNCEKGLPDDQSNIISDHEKIIAVFTNLLKNAFKFTSEGTINFGYKIEDEHIVFFVKDTGIGISEKRQKAIFDRFVQEDLTITKPYEGSGLGLSISKGLIDIMGGTIYVESEKGKGSSFYFTIKYEKSGGSKKNPGLISQKSLLGDRLKSVNVLIAEDDDSAFFYFQELLKKKCNKIYHAKSGEEAVDLCKNNASINLVLMDIKMPDIDGFEATRRIRKFNKEIIIIGQTAYALVGDKQKVLDAGCNDYITKPIDKNLLLTILAKYF
jgi:PAS domain S-box-containing protein